MNLSTEFQDEQNDGFDLEDSQEYADAVMTSQTSAAVELSPNAKSGKMREYSDTKDSGSL